YGLIKFLFAELIVNGKLLGMLVLLTVLSSVLQSLQSAFEKSSVSKVANAVIYMVLILFALNSFHIVTAYTEDAISSMTDFILAMLPVLLALIASGGGIISASFFHPVVIFLMNTSGTLIQSLVLPLLFISTVLSIVSTINTEYKVTK